MTKKYIFVFTLMLLMSGSVFLSASDHLHVKMRFFQGARKGELRAPEFVTSSFLQPTISATIPSKFLLEEEVSKIQKVFNLEDVALITEADVHFILEKNKWKHTDEEYNFRLNGKQFSFVLFPKKDVITVVDKEKTKSQIFRFHLQVFEQKTEKYQEMLATEFLLPVNKIAVFGFEDIEGNPYFLSFHITRYQATLPPPPPPLHFEPITEPITEIHTQEQIEEFKKGAVEVKGDIKPPKLIRKVSPRYPKEAAESKVEGIIILQARTDIYGRVQDVKVIKGKDPLLKEAAKEAVKQWVYEPLVINGEPREVVFTTTVSFELDKEEKEKVKSGTVGGVIGGVIKLGEGTKCPKLIKKVAPAYPERLVREGIQGVVILEVTTDKKGIPIDIEVKKSDSSLLNQPAIEAVKQWRYEPFFLNGEPQCIVFRVTVHFKLKENQ